MYVCVCVGGGRNSPRKMNTGVALAFDQIGICFYIRSIEGLIPFAANTACRHSGGTLYGKCTSVIDK